MKALITGAAGFIGSHLSRTLVDEGADVIGLDCFTDYYAREHKERNLGTLRDSSSFQFVESSIQDADLARLLDGVTHIFHLAAQAGVRKSWGRDFQIYTVNNIEATQALLEASAGQVAKGGALEKFVYASTSSVYGDATAIPMHEDARPQPVSPYGVTKLAGEHLCLLYFVNHRVPAVALRYFTVYGPHQRPDMGFHKFLKAAHEGAPITVYGDGEQTRDFTYVLDAVAATRLAGTKGVPGRVYNVGGGSRVSVNEVLALIEQIVGRPLNLAREADQKGDMRDTFADTSRAAADLGFAPKTSLAEGLAAEYAWLRSMLPAQVQTTKG